MNKFIVETLKPLNLPCYYVKKPQTLKGDYVTFNYNEEGFSYSNNKRELTLYQVTLNLVVKELKDGLKLKEQARNLLNELEIDAEVLPTYYNDELDCFVFILQFNHLM